MRYFRSQYSFKQYRPYKSAWRRFLESLRKRNSRHIVAAPIVNSYKLNPYKKPEKTPRFNTKSVKMIVLGLVIVIWAILMLYSPFFNMSEISYNGLRNITFNDINSFVQTSIFNCSRFLPCKNYFFVSSEKVEKKLMENFSLDSVRVEKVFPGELQIEFKEKISTVIYDNGNGYFMLDASGAAVKYLGEVSQSEFKFFAADYAATSSPEAKVWFSSSTVSSAAQHVPDYRKIKKNFGSYPILFDARATNVAEKQTDILPGDIIKSIIFWSGTLEKQGIAVKYFEMSNLEGIKTYTNQPWDFYYKPTADLDDQLSRLKTILIDNKPKEYIDLRYGGRVYWK